MKHRLSLALLFALLLSSVVAFAVYLKDVAPTDDVSEKQPVASKQSEKNGVDKPVRTPEYATPVAEFTKRATKKQFGTYITPQNSPVQPERFNGYHTGVDVEYEDITTDTPVRAISKGTVLYAGFVSGYGGLLVLKHEISGSERAVLYGHLNTTSLPDFGTRVDKGEKVGILGAHKSTETDGERKHLHFAILKTTQINYAGYVDGKDQLVGWLDPFSIYD